MSKKRVTRVDRGQKLLEKSPNGISQVDFKKEMGDMVLARTQGLINYLKNKRNCNIIFKDGIYYLKSIGNSPATNVSNLKPKSDLKADTLLLSSEDKAEYMDLMKRHFYYKMCADALIKSTTLASKLI